MSNTEKLLNALATGEDVSGFEPQSRMEEILKRICLEEPLDDLIPLSRVEVLLIEAVKNMASGRGEDKLKVLLDAKKSTDYLFVGCTLLESVDDFIKYEYTENATSMYSMFSGCKLLKTIPLLNTSKVTNMGAMFYLCENLTTIPLLNTSNVTIMSNMFYQCKVLTTIPPLDTSNVTNFESMFCFCSNLTTVPALNASKATNMYNTFSSCSKLKSILMYGMKTSFVISPSTQFEASDLVTILSNCQVVTSSVKLTMGSTNLAKLDGVYVKETGVEPYEGITVRPVTICESTDEGAMLATDYFMTKGWTLG